MDGWSPVYHVGVRMTSDGQGVLDAIAGSSCVWIDRVQHSQFVLGIDVEWWWWWTTPREVLQLLEHSG